MIEKQVKLDMNISVKPLIYTIQKTEKNSRKIIISFTASGVPFNIDEYSNIILQLDKPDGNTVLESINGDYMSVVDNKLEIIFTDQMSAAEGRAVGKIMFFTDSSMVASTLFCVDIEGGLIYGDIISTTEYNALVETMIRAEEAINVLKEVEADVENAEMSRVASEILRETAENTRKANEEARIKNETNRVSAETQRVSDFSNIVFEDETETGETGVNLYKIKIHGLNNELQSPNLINNMTIGDIETVSSNINASATITGDFGNQKLNLKIPMGASLKIQKTYDTVAEMNADFSNPDIELNQFVMIINEEDKENNGSIYIKSSTAFKYAGVAGSAQLEPEILSPEEPDQNKGSYWLQSY